MKKTTLTAVIMIMASVMYCGCTHIKKCDQPFSKEEIPDIYDNDYHTCVDVMKNFVYMVRGNNGKYLENYPYPYSSHIGDTIQLCGYIKHSYGFPIHYKDNWWYCTLTDDSVSAMNPDDYSRGEIMAQGNDKMLLDDANFSQKCYVIGYMTFNTPFKFLVSPPEPDDCFCLMPYFQVIEIRN